MKNNNIPQAISNALTSLKINNDVLFFSFLVFCSEFSLFKLLQYTTDYLNALTVISYALVGLGLGSWLTNWISTKGTPLFLNLLAAFWLCFTIAIWKILRAPSSGPDSLLISLAFIPSGIYLAKAFSTRMAHEVYWADLAGAALATVVTFLAIPLLSTEGFMGLLLLSVCVLGLIKCFYDPQIGKLRTALFLTLFCFSTILLYGIQTIPEWSPYYLIKKSPKKTLYKAFNRLTNYKLLKKYDNLVSRIEVIQSSDPKKKNTYRVVFDGIDNDGFDNARPSNTSKDARFVWGLFENPRIFIVGASAQGIIKTARNITTPDGVSGVEINPAIYQIMTKDFASVANFPYQNTSIKVNNALHYLRNSKETYDIITLINIHSTARISIPGSPDTMQCVESYETYLKHLSDRGYLMIEERPDTKASDNAIHRQIVTIYEALKRSGATNPTAHFFIYSWRYSNDNKFKPHTFDSYTAMLVKKTPLTEADRKAILDWYSIRIKTPPSSTLPTAKEITTAEKKSKFRLDYLKNFYETKRYSHLFDSITKGTLSQDYPEWDLRIVDLDKPYLPYIHK
ncbi:MAG: hypothetical protein HQL21_08195, partial [Candidatus Omnitrophica bacterium]|nr:hypothetical protein [Candidatus Omnitrophota bacterium]